jgi:hypothetical protein
MDTLPRFDPRVGQRGITMFVLHLTFFGAIGLIGSVGTGTLISITALAGNPVWGGPAMKLVPLALTLLAAALAWFSLPRRLSAPANTLGPPGTYVVDQRGRTAGGCIDLSDVVSLEILERSLFGAAPRGEVTESVAVPADQCCQARASRMARMDIGG